MKCRDKREISEGHLITLKNNRVAFQGKCPKCATKITRMGDPNKNSRDAYQEVYSTCGP